MSRHTLVLTLTALALGGATRATAGTNPYRGRQSRTEVFEFTVKPKVEKRSGKYVITFASKAACDATVAIVDPSTSSGQGGKGKIVRHLASGVLGKNAPAPFKQNSLTQSIEWDGKDDRGKAVSPGCKIKVSLGLKANLDRFLGWSPEAMPMKSFAGIAAGPNGDVFLLTQAHEGSGLQSTTINLYVFGRDGKHKRRLLPPPCSVPPERATLMDWVKTTWGAKVPARNHSYIVHSVVRKPGWVNVPLQTPVITREGKFLFIVGTRSGRSLVMASAKDGSTPPGSIVPLKIGIRLGSPILHMALSPDGKWLYIGGGSDHYDAKKRTHAVWRMSMRKPGEVTLYLGDASKSGADNKHFDRPCGMACDKAGNLYVADFGNNRVQVFKPDGSHLKTIASKEPQRVAVSHKTGDIYVLQNGGAKLVKLGGLKNPTVKAELSTGRRAKHPVQQPCIALDETSSPASVWISRCGLGLPEFVRRYEQRGGKFTEAAAVGVRPRKGWEAWKPWTPSPYLEADPYREELYIRTRGMCFPNAVFRVNGRSGKLIEKFKFAVDGKTWGLANTMFEQCRVGPDRMVYMRLTMNGRWIARYDPDKRQFVSLPNYRPVEASDPPGKSRGKVSFRGKPVMGFHVPSTGTGYNFVYMMGIAPNGDLYIPARPTKDYFAKIGNPGWFKKRVGFYWQLRVYSREGKLKCLNALPGTGVTDGVRIGRTGAVYMVMSCQPAGSKVPEGIAPGSKFDKRVWGTLVKFGSSLDKYPVGKVVVDKAKPTHYWGRLGAGRDVRMDGMLWDYGGVGPVPNVHCHCWKSNFDLDLFERSFLPAAPTCTVNVLDANGNIVVRLGGYGNADSMGKDSPVMDPKTGELRPRRPGDPKDLKSPLAEPELGFIEPAFVAVTDEALYVHDRGNERIVRAKLGYYAEETVVVP
jgi:DNA-binding beta-propeller fold protein YncE